MEIWGGIVWIPKRLVRRTEVLIDICEVHKPELGEGMCS